MDEQGIVGAARAVRPYLPELVGPAAAELDGKVARLLNGGPEGVPDPVALPHLLDATAATHVFLQAVLADAPHYRPPAVQLDTRRAGYQEPPGELNPVLHLGIYVCPPGDLTWYRLSSAASVPPCPTHGPGLRRQAGPA
jgi:hypothetical protein